jgi:flagellar biosynthetic protein FliR
MNDVGQLLQIMLNLPLMALVMARISGLVIFAPFFSSAVIPAKTRIFLAAFITIIVLPFAAVDIVPPANLGDLVAAITGELLVGLLVGLIVNIIFTALQIAGNLIDQQIGLSAAQLFDPLFSEQTSIMSQLYFWLGMIIFLLVRGHIVLLGALAKSFHTIPIGQFAVNETVLTGLTKTLQMSFVLALQISAPLTLAIFLTTLAMGFIARTMPQLNILSVGFSIRLLLGFILLIICLIPAIQLFMGVMDRAFTKIYEVLNF